MGTMRYPSLEAVLVVHRDLIAQFGGNGGVRDQGLLDSALHKPQQLAAYGLSTDLADLAAALCVGIAKNHPFVDGNKRTALVVAASFLASNGCEVKFDNEESFELMLAVATNAAGQPRVAKWFRQRISDAQYTTASTPPQLPRV